VRPLGAIPMGQTIQSTWTPSEPLKKPLAWTHLAVCPHILGVALNFWSEFGGV
jgi:hypothetical protein